MSNSLGVNVGPVGKFALNGTLLGTAGLTNAFVTSIAGSGTSAGVADVFGNLFPGDTNVVGTLSLGGLIAEDGSSLYFDLGFNNTPGVGNDLIQVNGNLVLGASSITINPLALLKKAPGFSYRLINYTGTLVTNAIPTVIMPQNYVGTLDFSTANQVNLRVTGGPSVWDGGSATGSYWSDSANWGNVAIFGGASLFFGGNVRVNNTNDSSAGTSYQDLGFNVDAAPFTLNGNDINLTGNILNTSTNAQTILIPMSSSAANNTFNGGTNGPLSQLIIGAGWTNTSSGVTSNTLVGVGTWTNLFFNPNAGSNTFELLDTNANWTLVDNSALAPMTLPLQLDVQQGKFSFGQGSSSPVLTNTSLVNSRVGVLTNGPATFNMNNGTLAIAARLNTGVAGGSSAVLNQSGGVLDLQTLLQISDGAATASSTVNVSGGTLNVGTPTAQTIFLCSRGTGVFNVTLTGQVKCGTFDVSRNIGPTFGKVNLDGGSMTVNRVGTATGSATATQVGAIAIFNFNGGILRARQNNAAFFQGSTASPVSPITALVRSGGAIIDANGFDISVLEPLQHDTNSLAPATDGGLVKFGAGTLTLAAANTYTGPTFVTNGTLAVTGSLGTNTVTVTNATLAGIGIINGAVTLQSGGVLSPAGNGVTGALTVSNNVTFQPGSTAIMEVNKSPTANDLLITKNTNATTISFNGTLIVTNLAGNYANGDSFKLFSATNYSGTFTSIQPSQPAIGFKWDTNQLYTAGILTVVGLPHPGITTVSYSGGNLLIGGTNGTAGLSYRVLGSPDILLPQSSWTILGTNTFGGSGNFLFTVGATNQVQFFAVQAL
jgi:autotransporter-associated beta strand protein